VLLLDADESLTPELADEISRIACRADVNPLPGEINAHNSSNPIAYAVPRRNFNFGRWIRHAGYYPDRKLRLMRRGSGCVENCPINEELKVPDGVVGSLKGDLIHHCHYTLTDFVEHVNRYSSLGAEMKGPRAFSVVDVVLRPAIRFIYDYFFRLGFLDGPEGLCVHLYRAFAVSLRYAKAWELGRDNELPERVPTFRR